MQSSSEPHAPTNADFPSARRQPAAWWLPLVAAAILLPFANGATSIPLVAWLAPLFLLRFSRSVRRAAIAAGVTLVLQAVALMIQFRGMVPLPAVIYAAVMLTYGLGFTLPYLVDHRLHRRLSPMAATLVFPSCWAAIEFLMSRGPFGSWFSAGYSQYGNLPLLQLLSVTGLWGVTFLIGWTASAGNAVWEQWPISRRVPPVARAWAAIVAAVILAGGARLALVPPAGPTVRVASLSRIDPPLHPDPRVLNRFFQHKALTPGEVATIRERAAAIDDDLLHRSEREARAGARIVFWGEANAPVMKDQEDELVRRGGIVAKNNGIYLGMALASWHLETTPPLENKIVLIQPDGRPAWEFFKAHPVPGGEAAISIRRDGKLPALDTPYGRLSAIVCFDADFPRLLAQAGRMGADIVLDPSNDWKAIDPWHTKMASFRAIEQGFNLVRHTRGGLSAAFDYQGRALASMDHYATSDRVLVAEVPTHGVRTTYAVFGDWMGWLSFAGLAVLWAKSRRSPRAAAIP